MKNKELIISLWLFLSFTIGQLSTADAGMFEDLGAGARPLAMGKSFIAVANDASAVYWNPAGLTQVEKDEITTMYADLYNMGLVSYQSICFAHPGIAGGSMGLGYLRTSTTEKVTFLDFQENTFLLSYAISPIRYFSVGVSLKYFLADFDTKGSGAGIDTGILFNYGNRISVAVMVQNVDQPKIQFQTGGSDCLPSNLKAGLAFMPVQGWVISSDLVNIIDDPQVHLGTEYWITKHFAMRLGGIKQYQNNWTYSGGLGIKYKVMQLDYAYQRHFDLDDTHYFSLGLRF
jgi:hypothetical protein